MDAIFRHFRRYAGVVITLNFVGIVGFVVGVIGLFSGSLPSIIVGAAFFLAPYFVLAVMAWRILHSKLAEKVFAGKERGFTPADLVHHVSPIQHSDLSGFTPERPVTDQFPEERQRG